MPRSVKSALKVLPEIQELARRGDMGDGALLMSSGIPESSLHGLRERDAADPRRVALRTASADAKRRARNHKVSLAAVSLPMQTVSDVPE